jgi:shikimate dehydrogenase
MPSVLDFIENKDVNLSQTEIYAAILGESPSKGAKSPTLWNAAFEGLSLSGRMHPMDVQAERLEDLVAHLKKDRRFIGGAVTMPYKIQIIPFLDEIEPEAEAIGAVNCIYRGHDKLIGANTDGAGAIWSLKKYMPGSIEGKYALLMGTGGAGFAVAAYLAAALGPQGRLQLLNRSSEARNQLVRRLEGKCKIEIGDWPLRPDQVKAVDILINCSSVGFETAKTDGKGAFSLRFYTPLGPLDDSIRVTTAEEIEKRYLIEAAEAIKTNYGHSLDVLASADHPFVFDIIYQPQETVLLFLAKMLGYQTLNGVPMNLEQAVIAFEKATVELASDGVQVDRNQIRTLMRKVW